MILGFVFYSGNAQIVEIPDANFKAKLLAASPSNTIANANGVYVKIDANDDGEIQYTEASTITALNVSDSNISDLTGIAAFSYLYTLLCNDNNLSTLNLSGIPYLNYLNCSYNQLNFIDYSGLNYLSVFRCDNNMLTQLYLSELVYLHELRCGNNLLTSINFENLTALTDIDCDNNHLTYLTVTDLPVLKTLNCNANQLTGISLSGLGQIETLNINDNYLFFFDPTGLANLRNLNCENNQIEGLNLTPLVNLENLYAGGNLMNTFIAPNSPNLNKLYLQDNLLSTIDLSQNLNLERLILYHNSFTELNVNYLVNLHELGVGMNNFTALNIGNLVNLNSLEVYTGSLTAIDLTNNINLFELNFYDNNLTTLDLSHQHIIQSVNVSNNPNLQSVFLKNGSNEGIIFNECPALQYICADEIQIPMIESQIAFIDSPAITNSYCSFVPGGDFYAISGNVKMDLDENGCDIFDGNVGFTKFVISTNALNSVTFANGTGGYAIPVQSGGYTLTPVVEYPEYFNISPTTVAVNFPDDVSPNLNDFCITANGVHPDMEITFIPITAARPGFDASYKIVIKNKGNMLQSGLVNLNYDDSVFDYVSSNPTATQLSENLTWSFTDLLPFESREILVTMNLNAPNETPSVVGGEILYYTATITSNETDETQNDNISTLYQTVVNSFDPNDKTCAEGQNLPPELAGTYVHYVIRFENTGTANAQNIVVKDMIDTTKFDVSSLIPLDGSHSFTTRITNTNKVEFIFENIQLPFDDSNNDGYLAFKIKTLPTLVAGNTFINTASIYFDYNAPIVTNTATTTLQALGTDDFAFDNYFILYPNPANEVLTIQSNKNIQITSVAVYNTLGQLVLVIPDAASGAKIDVSDLTAGNYFLKVSSNKGASGSRFVKR